MREFTLTSAEDLYELVCERCRVGSNITTSNRSPVGWYALFPNAVLAESALDRLVNSAPSLLLAGRHYRPLRRHDGGRIPPPPEDGHDPLDEPPPRLHARADEGGHHPDPTGRVDPSVERTVDLSEDGGWTQHLTIESR